MALNGRHPGVRLVHEHLGLDCDPVVPTLYTHISSELPSEHGKFYSNLLPFLPAVTLDALGRPWVSILAGEPGFIRNPQRNTLEVEARMWEGDPLIENINAYERKGAGMLIAGIGIEFSTRQRNKFAGFISRSKVVDDMVQLEMKVNQALGNCPKYITLRTFTLHPNASCIVVHRKDNLLPSDHLPNEITSFITEADTSFLGTSYAARTDDAKLYPSHLGINHRGGRKGFIRLLPSDGRTIVIPDYSGDRFMTSLGNIEYTPLAALTIVSFQTGDILYLTGCAKNLYGAEARKLMPLQNTLTTIQVSSYILVRDALPFRQMEKTMAEPSPYSPPIRYLSEERPILLNDEEKEPPMALLTHVTLHSSIIATFAWESSKDLSITPGQSVILDFSPLLGNKEYHHMSPIRPSAINDDRIRTWTVSSASASSSRSFSLTMREKEGGMATGALFSIARNSKEFKPSELEDLRAWKISVRVVGVTGDFTLPAHGAADNDKESTQRKMLWIAGGIGVTPFLSMLKALNHKDDEHWDIIFLLSTREPETLIPLVLSSLANTSINIHIHVFSDSDASISNSIIPGATVVIQKHIGRLGEDFIKTVEDLRKRSIYLCGPEAFEEAIMGALESVGADVSAVKREGFEY